VNAVVLVPDAGDSVTAPVAGVPGGNAEALPNGTTAATAAMATAPARRLLSLEDVCFM
jgi:hypothetical protein